MNSARLPELQIERQSNVSQLIRGSTKGSTTRTLAFSKSLTLRVATINPCSKAVAAMRLSLNGMARPDARSSASSRAQRSALSDSHGRHSIPCMPARNQRSSLCRFCPHGSRRIPNLISPRMIGSTAISRSLRRSHSTTPACGLRLVGSLRTLASTRYFTECPSIRNRWE